MAHDDVQEWKWRGIWRMDCVASTLHTTSEHGVSSITTADAHISAASCRLNWRPRRFKWTRPFRRKTKSGFCACAITFQTQSAMQDLLSSRRPFRWRIVQYNSCWGSGLFPPCVSQSMWTVSHPSPISKRGTHRKPGLEWPNSKTVL